MNKYRLAIKKGKIKHTILLEKSSVCCQGMEMVATGFGAIWHYLMILEIFVVCDSALTVLDIFHNVCICVPDVYKNVFCGIVCNSKKPEMAQILRRVDKLCSSNGTS